MRHTADHFGDLPGNNLVQKTVFLTNRLAGDRAEKGVVKHIFTLFKQKKT